MSLEKTYGEREGGTPLLRLLLPELYAAGAHRGTELLLDALTFGVALLLARTHLVFGIYPFALAFVAAGRRRVVAAGAGAVLGAATMPGVGGVFAIATLLLLLLRTVFSLPLPHRRLLPVSPALFGEGVALRTLAAALSGAALAAYELSVSGGERYSLLFASLVIPVPALLALLFSFAADAAPAHAVLFGGLSLSEGGEARLRLVELSLLALCLSLCFALLPLSLFGLSLASLFTSGAALLASRRFGAARGAAVGLFLGLLSGLTGAPAYALLGLVSGLLFPFGTVYGTLGGLLAALVFAGYAEGVSGFLAVAPEGASAILLLFPVLSRIPVGGDPAAAELSQRRLLDAATAAGSKRDGGRLARLGTALSSLATLFFRLSDEERRPAATEYFMECQRVCARFCATCSNRVRCWEQGKRVAETAMLSLSSTLRERGRVTLADLPSELREGCRRADEMLDAIRDECAAMSLRRHKGDRNEFLSLDYAMLAKLLSDAAERDKRESLPDEDATSRLREALGRAGDGLCPLVFGTRERRVVAAAASASLLSARAEPLRAAAERTLGCRLSPPTEAREGGVATLHMTAARRFAVRRAASSVPVGGGGDRIRFFETGEELFYAVLSDGMGSDEGAAATAEVTVEFLETMLMAGAGRRASLQMLNNLVRTQRTECSASVDLFIFDLLYGSATFLKSGAAPSYIKRGEEILRISSSTMPIGLVRMPDTELVRVELMPGDVLILLSDGIVPDGEEPAWLAPLLAEEDAANLDAFATRIVAEAVSRIPEPRDDITVGVLALDAL